MQHEILLKNKCFSIFPQTILRKDLLLQSSLLQASVALVCRQSSMAAFLAIHPRLATAVRHRSILCPRQTFSAPYRPLRMQGASLPDNPVHRVRRTAAALIIGDEILTGKTNDTNTGTLARHLFARGVTLVKTETVRDDIQTISECVKRLSSTHDLLFTSGGIGPTHDDVTYEAVANAFNVPLVQCDETLKMMRRITPEMDINKARLRMATLPENCEKIWTEGLWVPLCCVNGNVYVLPGVPFLFSKMLASIPEERFGNCEKLARAIVYTELAEGDLARSLSGVAERYSGIAFGSYPSTNEDARKLYRTKLTIEGEQEEDVRKAAGELAALVDGSVQSVG